MNGLMQLKQLESGILLSEEMVVIELSQNKFFKEYFKEGFALWLKQQNKANRIVKLSDNKFRIQLKMISEFMDFLNDNVKTHITLFDYSIRYEDSSIVKKLPLAEYLEYCYLPLSRTDKGKFIIDLSMLEMSFRDKKHIFIQKWDDTNPFLQACSGREMEYIQMFQHQERYFETYHSFQKAVVRIYKQRIEDLSIEKFFTVSY